jgi:hypothetical protein
MPRLRRPPKRRRTGDFEPWELRFALDEIPPDIDPVPDDVNPFKLLIDGYWFPGPRDEAPKDLWHRTRAAALPIWVRRHPGTRPSLWWAYEAGEDPPEDQRARLEELGALLPHEAEASPNNPGEGDET